MASGLHSKNTPTKANDAARSNTTEPTKRILSFQISLLGGHSGYSVKNILFSFFFFKKKLFLLQYKPVYVLCASQLAIFYAIHLIYFQSRTNACKESPIDCEIGIKSFTHINSFNTHILCTHFSVINIIENENLFLFS